MNVVIRHLDHVRFAAEARGHSVIVDQPKENQGDDSGLTPPELLLASLGSCAAYYAVEYLRTRHLPVDGVRVDVDAEKVLHPARIGSFQLRIQVPALDERHQESLLRSVKRCLVHNTLHALPEISLALEMTPAPEPVSPIQ